MNRWSLGTLIVTVATVLAACGSGTGVERLDDQSSPAAESSTTTSSAAPSSTRDTASDPSDRGDEPMTDSSAKSPVPPADRSYEGDRYPPELTGLVETAIGDLAIRLGVESESISVVTVDEVVWPNGGLGCERPDMKYTQVPVDGLRIVLTYDGTTYDYHSGGTTEPFLCAPGTAKDPGSAGREPDIEIDGIIPSEETIPVDESLPTEQPGGPGGEPDV